MSHPPVGGGLEEKVNIREDGGPLGGGVGAGRGRDEADVVSNVGALVIDEAVEDGLEEAERAEILALVLGGGVRREEKVNVDEEMVDGD